jgi:Ca-activated chloride channel family protein
MVNYFSYRYPDRAGEHPFGLIADAGPCPWADDHRLVRVALQARRVDTRELPPSNLVFLIDVSGSMQSPDKLPLVKRAFRALVQELRPRDRVAIVVYAGAAGLVLPSTPGSRKSEILDAIERLEAGGSTAGGAGLKLAYDVAREHFLADGNNRVILATDGDFNVGITDQGELKGYIERERGTGVFLSVLGFGMGNYNDALMQTLAQNGNGIAAYIDTVAEARKTLVEEASSTLFPIAKDVKIQVEFNPAAVAEYRLIGYETRALNREDFDNDKVDAGDVGSGQTVTALYEIVPVGGPRTMTDLRYGKTAASIASRSNEIGFVKIRYKLPKSGTSRLISTPIDRRMEARSFEAAPRDARFATAVAGFAELLRGGKHTGSLSYDDVQRIAKASRGSDEFG